MQTKGTGPSLLNRPTNSKLGVQSPPPAQVKVTSETPVTDMAFELKMRHTTNNFYSEQEDVLSNEKLLLSEKTQVLLDEIATMAKLERELEGKIETVSNLLEREQNLSNQYSSNIAATKESIASGEVYIRNMKTKLDNMENEKKKRDEEIAERHKDLTSEVLKTKGILKNLQESIEELQEERDDLWNRWQAKIEIQRQSDAESSP